VRTEGYYGPFPDAYITAIQASAVAISSGRPCEAVVILSDALTATDIDVDVPQNLPTGAGSVSCLASLRFELDFVCSVACQVWPRRG
jgi:hypothetical protein